ncbi:hypothetical protein, partial [Pseudomonas helleri]|uniref:hypothetical protein n=1 Tax=Pseudomonas helleri TaxID=1608996 RepID=UPI003F9953F9
MFYGEIPARFTVTSAGKRIVSGDEVLNILISTVGASLSRDLLILALFAAAARPDVASQGSSTATGVRDTTVGASLSRDLLILALFTAAARPDVA